MLITIAAIVFWIKVFNWLWNWCTRMYAGLWHAMGSPCKRGLNDLDIDPTRVLNGTWTRK
jgi:hypothetical protein